jgi:hypothetical protein
MGGREEGRAQPAVSNGGRTWPGRGGVHTTRGRYGVLQPAAAGRGWCMRTLRHGWIGPSGSACAASPQQDVDWNLPAALLGIALGCRHGCRARCGTNPHALRPAWRAGGGRRYGRRWALCAHGKGCRSCNWRSENKASRNELQPLTELSLGPLRLCNCRALIPKLHFRVLMLLPATDRLCCIGIDA